VKALSDSRLPLLDGLEEERAANPAPLHSVADSPDPARAVMAGLDPAIRSPAPVQASPATQDQTPLPQPPDANEPPVHLPPMTEGHQVVEDYRSTGLSLRRHPVSFLRADLAARRIVRCADLATLPEGRRITVAGLVLVRQRPGSARGVLFMTIEDETGHANLIVWPSVFEAQRRLILSAGMVACRGKLQRESGVTHVIADRLTDLSDLLRSVEQRDGAAHPGGAALAGQDVRDIHVDGPIPQRSIKVRTRDFR
jgi:DNA polymerase III alpha subunit